MVLRSSVGSGTKEATSVGPSTLCGLQFLGSPTGGSRLFGQEQYLIPLISEPM